MSEDKPGRDDQRVQPQRTQVEEAGVDGAEAAGAAAAPGDSEGAEDEGGDGQGGDSEAVEDGAVEDDDRQTFGQAVWAGVREIVIVVVMATVLSFVVKTWLLQAFYIPSGSMEDTLVRDDRVIISKLTPGPFDLSRGDIVVFEDPGNWLMEAPKVQRTGFNGALHATLVFVGLLPDDSDNHLIKRVVGLPGDHVTCCDTDARLVVNGASLTEPYVKAGDTPNGDRPPFDIVVPAGRVWVMGDHRSDSSDSRLHDDGKGRTGSVPIEKVTGRAVTVVWPVDHVTWLSQPERVFRSVPPPGSTAPTPPATGTPAP